MLKAFQSFIHKNHLASSQAILIGVSGGRDSVVLCDLYHQLQIPFAIAHCNFSLRAQESDEDEFFVVELSKKYNVPFHSITFDTKEHAKQNGISIQMAARELRLSWFQKLCESFNYEYYATAHHQDDTIETYLINQIRGTGISGLHGILPKQDSLIHPLLFASRENITEYAETQSILWREDSSNAENKYIRNQVRNELIPLFTNINSNIKKVLIDNMERIYASEQIYKAKIEECKTEMSFQKNEELYIELDKLTGAHQAPTILYEMIKAYGFNFDQCKQILDLDENSMSGALMQSTTHQLLRNREHLILKNIDAGNSNQYILEKGSTELNDPLSLKVELSDSTEILKQSNIAQLDANKISFPLHLRKWQQGDFFYPLGMKGQKKLLSDFFIDQKLSLFEKENIWLLCCKEDILWVIGHRIDNRFKIRPETKRTLQITLLNTDC